MFALKPYSLCSQTLPHHRKSAPDTEYPHRAELLILQPSNGARWSLHRRACESKVAFLWRNYSRRWHCWPWWALYWWRVARRRRRLRRLRKLRQL